MPDKKYRPFDPILEQGRAVPYRPVWNRLTGSPLATILLQQIIFWWHVTGRKPFHKYAAPCARARPGDSWLEELGFSRRQFETARAKIATRTRRRHKDRDLKSSLVVYWTERDHRTWYAVNESLLRSKLTALGIVADTAAPDGADAHQSHVRNRQPSAAQNEQVPMIESAAPYTEKSKHKKQKTGMDDVSLDQELVAALERLGDNNPQELVAKYPDSAIRRWLDYANSPKGGGLTNKPGFIRSKLKLSVQRKPRYRAKQSMPSPKAAHRFDRAERAAATSARYSDPPEAGQPRGSRSKATEAERIWDSCLQDLQGRMTRATYSRWLWGTRALHMSDGTLQVAVNNAYIKDWLDHRLRSTIDETVNYVAGDLTVEFVVTI